MGRRFGRTHHFAILVAIACALPLVGGCSEHSGVSSVDGGVEGGATDAMATPIDGQAEASGDDLTVSIADGPVQADLVGGARRFLKIPFAKPPVGNLRWKAPVPNDPWTVLRHEPDFSDACPQAASQQGPASNHEDCLYLNVWTPEPAPSKAPVMVWFHGGGNFAGSTRDNVPLSMQLWYDGQFFAARHGIVLVTTNYRLGAMGFFPHPALAAEQSPAGNQGLFDQRAALQWVQKNIAKFGGDPGNVTIFGESAGSADVCYHVASGMSGLFHRAISESGGCASTTIGGARMPTAADAATGMQTFTQTMGCDTASDPLACLRSKSVDDILKNAPQPNLTGGVMLTTSFSFSAVVDGAFLPDQPRTLFDTSKIVQVPYLLGSNNDEGMLFLLNATIPTTDAAYLSALQNNFGMTFGQQVFAEYPVSKFNGDYHAALAQVIGDSGLICGTHDTARRAAKAGSSVFMYNFNMPWSILNGTLKVSHASEISHVFGDPLNPSADDTAVSDAMNAFWAHFAQTGDPNYPGAPATWPAFKPDANDDDDRLQLDPGWKDLKSFRKQECTFWRQYYDQAFAP
jgi:para-nitrobenzyl esterase